MTTNSTYSYHVGGSVPIDAPCYVMRQADSDFYQSLKAGEFCYVLNSRQMGKSSLRVRTMQRLQAEGVACAAIDITAIGTSDITPEEWYAGIIDSIVGSLELYDRFDLETWWTGNHLLSYVQRFSKFIEEVLLKEFSDRLVIFVDEIDSVLSLNFNIDDFFAVIRECYNRRADRPDYQRINFALIGVATPSDLIADKRRTPFNIGRAIELGGFQLKEAQPLAVGLAARASNPQAVLQAILDLTGGQPFLTQKVCRLVLASNLAIPEGKEADWVEQLVEAQVIQHWEAQDEPEHLKTIRDRILRNEQRAGRLLGIYQQILQPGTSPGGLGLSSQVPADDSPEQMDLRLSGLVVRQQGYLRSYNRVYKSVFNLSWVEKELTNLRPYAEVFRAWLDSSYQDESRLLRGQALQDALAWAAAKSLSDLDYQFLTLSQDVEKREVENALEAEKKARELENLAAEINLEAERKQRELAIAEAEIAKLAEQSAREAAEKANQILAEAQTKARRTIGIGAVVMVVMVAIAILAGIIAQQKIQTAKIAQQEAEIAQAGTKIEQQGAYALQTFDYDQREALLSAMYAGQGLKKQVKKLAEVKKVQSLPLKDYPAASPHLALQTILDKIWKPTPLQGHQDSVNSASFSPDGQHIVTVSRDKTARVWDLSGKQLALLQGHQDSVNSASFSPDGQHIVTASDDKTARVWDLTGKQLALLQGHQATVISASFSSDGQHIVTASRDKTARVWDLSGQQLALLQGHQDSVNSASFSPDGQHIVTVSDDKTARVWDLSGQQLTLLQGHQSHVWSASFSPDGQHIVTASDDKTARVWDLTGKQLALLQGHHYHVRSASFSSDGQHIVTASDDKTARVWDLTGKQLALLQGHQGIVWRSNGLILIKINYNGKAG